MVAFVCECMWMLAAWAECICVYWQCDIFQVCGSWSQLFEIPTDKLAVSLSCKLHDTNVIIGAALNCGTAVIVVATNTHWQ